MLVGRVGKLAEQMAVWVRQELVSFKGEGDQVLLQPLLLARKALVRGGVGLELPQVVPELVIAYNARVRGLLRVLDAVGVVVVLRWSRDHDALCLQL